MADKEKEVCGRKPRRLEELNLLDNFLFQEMVSGEEDGAEFCRILLKTILNRTIHKVKVIPQKNIPGVDTDRHGIRLDAYIEEERLADGEELEAEVESDIYDIEPNKVYEKGKILPRRMRYYHGLIDTKLLAAGTRYDRLPNVVIIVILPYDPFGQNRMVYTIENHCVEDASVCYDDGVKKIFLYTKGTEGNPGRELQDMLKYMEESTEENVTNPDIEKVHRFVQKIKHKAEIGVNYMKSWEWDEMIREEATREGMEQGLAQGLEQGIEQGIEQGLEQGLEQARNENIAQMTTVIRNLMNNLGMTADQAMASLGITGEEQEKYRKRLEQEG